MTMALSSAAFTKQDLVNVLVLCVMQFSSFLGFTIIAPFFPQQAVAKGLSSGTIGWIISIFEISLVLFQFVIATIVSRRGVYIRFAIFGGGLLCGSSTIGFGLLKYVDNSSLFTALCLLLRLTEALGTATMNVANYTALGEWFQGRKLYIAQSVMQGGYTMAIISGPPIGAALYALEGYVSAITTTGGIVICISVGLSWVYPHSAKEHGECGGVIGALTIKKILIIGLVSVQNGIMFTYLVPLLALYLRDLGLSTAEGGLVFMVGPVAYLVALPINTFLTNRGHMLSQCIGGLFMSALGLIIIGPEPLLHIPRGLTTVIIGLTIHGAGLSTSYQPVYMIMTDAAVSSGKYVAGPMTANVIATVIAVFHSFGSWIGPIISGNLGDWLGFQGASNVGGVFAAISALGISLVLWIVFSAKSQVGLYHGTIHTIDDKTPLLFPDGEKTISLIPQGDGKTLPHSIKVGDTFVFPEFQVVDLVNDPTKCPFSASRECGR